MFYCSLQLLNMEELEGSLHKLGALHKSYTSELRKPLFPSTCHFIFCEFLQFLVIGCLPENAQAQQDLILHQVHLFQVQKRTLSLEIAKIQPILQANQDAQPLHQYPPVQAQQRK